MTGETGPRPEPSEPRPGGFQQAPPEDGRPQPRRERGEPPIIEGEFERLDERPIDPRRKDGRNS